jgi:hypothetical protein
MDFLSGVDAFNDEMREYHEWMETEATNDWLGQQFRRPPLQLKGCTASDPDSLSGTNWVIDGCINGYCEVLLSWHDPTQGLDRVPAPWMQTWHRCPWMCIHGPGPWRMDVECTLRTAKILVPGLCLGVHGPWCLFLAQAAHFQVL